METQKALPAPIETKDDLISQLTIESIPFAALNERCKRATSEDGVILDGALAREKKDSVDYMDKLLDKFNALGKTAVDAVLETPKAPSGRPGPAPELAKPKCHEDHIIDCKGTE